MSILFPSCVSKVFDLQTHISNDPWNVTIYKHIDLGVIFRHKSSILFSGYIFFPFSLFFSFILYSHILLLKSTIYYSRIHFFVFRRSNLRSCFLILPLFISACVGVQEINNRGRICTKVNKRCTDKCQFRNVATLPTYTGDPLPSLKLTTAFWYSPVRPRSSPHAPRFASQGHSRFPINLHFRLDTVLSCNKYR